MAWSKDGLLRLGIDAARKIKWKAGQEKYGPVFVGDPLEELYAELADALNYIDEAERQGIKISTDTRQYILQAGLEVRLCALNMKIDESERRNAMHTVTDDPGDRVRREITGILVAELAYWHGCQDDPKVANFAIGAIGALSNVLAGMLHPERYAAQLAARGKK